jgi:hypothetical protein
MAADRASVLRERTTVEQLREIVVRQDIPESRSEDEAGIFFVIEGPNEVSLQYNLPGDTSTSPSPASSRKARNDLLRCCGAIADVGFAVTLLSSPRTLALFVRS